MNNWNFVESKIAYLYPSANSDDGGAINSELNVKNITKHLINKFLFTVLRSVMQVKNN